MDPLEYAAGFQPENFLRGGSFTVRTLRIASAVAVSALLVGTLAACGGDKKDGAGSADAKATASAPAAKKELSPQEALLASAAVMDKAGSAKLTVTGGDSPGTASYVWKAPQAIEMTMREEGKDVKLRFIGDVMYMEAPAEMATIAKGKKWMKIDFKALAASGSKAAAGADEFAGVAGVVQALNPAVQLAAAAPTATKVGPESVGGVETVHYKSEVEVDALVAKLTLAPELRAKVAEKLKEDGSKSTLEFWINAKGEVVKETNSDSKNNETIVYSELGTVTAPAAPAAAETFDFAEMLKMMGQ